MIDLHTHILMNVDDGSSSLEMSRAMLKLEIKNGVDTVVLTPHFIYDDKYQEKLELIKKQYKILLNKCNDLNERILLGAEIKYSDDLLYRAKNKMDILTINKSKYILIELTFHKPFYRPIDKLYSLLTYGYKPILAHPERYHYLSIDELIEIKELGINLQINTSSLLKDFSKLDYTRAINLLKNDAVDFIASDCHSISVRAPNMMKVKKFLDKYKIKNEVNFDE